MKKLIILLSLLPFLASAQNDSTRVNDEDIDMNLEDVVTSTEIDENVDYTFITDYLIDYQRNPLNLNAASREELLRLPSMNDLLINNLFQHINQFGELTSLYELQAVSGFSKDIFLVIKPYVKVDGRDKDISPGSLHPTGPPLKEVWNGLSGDIIQRFVMIAEEQRGYTAPDTNSDGSLSTRYAGGPVRSYSRIRMRYKNNFSFAITAEKDAGERFAFDPDQKLYGYDYLSGHLYIGNYGRLKSLVVGDYTIQAGQGMILSRGLGFGKGAETINNVKMPNSGIRPYSSVNENQYLRGTAATYAFKRIHVTGFFSRVGRDASVGERDTVTNETLEFSSLQISGLHRTPTEISNRKAIQETMVGGRVEYKSNTLTIGTSHYYQRFGSEISLTPNEYNQFDLQGRDNYLNGLDFDWVVKNFNVFGEVGRSKSGGTGVVAGLMGSIAKTTDISLVFRNFTKDFHSNRGYVFAERPIALQNERGIYVGIKIKPTPKWIISSYFDRFYFPWNRFGVSFPSNGHEYLGQVEFKPKRGTSIYIRYRSDNKETNVDSDFIDEDQPVKYLVNTQRNSFRLHFQTKIGRDLSLRTRGETAWYKEEGFDTQRGFLIYQDISWRLTYSLRVTARYAIFDAPDYNARIYAYENDILGFFSIPAYYRQGSRYYVMLNYKFPKGFEAWFRVAQTRLHQSSGFGSGLEAVEGSRRTELKFQLRWKF